MKTLYEKYEDTLGYSVEELLEAMEERLTKWRLLLDQGVIHGNQWRHDLNVWFSLRLLEISSRTRLF